MLHIKLVFTLLFVLCITSVSGALTAYWEFENNLNDYSNNGYSLVLGKGNSFNDTVYKTGSYSRYGNGTAFSGDNVTNQAFNFTTNNFTIAFWFKSPTGSLATVMAQSYADATDADGFQIRYGGATNNNIAFRTPSTIFGISNLTAYDNNWKRIVITREGTGAGRCKIYLNGNLTNITACGQNFGKNVLIVGGGGGGSTSFTGNLDGVKILNGEAWSAEQVTLDWTSGGGLIVSLASPSNNSFFLTQGSLVGTATSPSELVNATLNVWYTNNTLYNRTTIGLTANYNSSNVTLYNLPPDIYRWNYYICNSQNCTWANQNYTFTTGYLQNAITYNSSTYEFVNETFILNVTVPSGYYISAEFFYNNVSQGISDRTTIGGNTIFTDYYTVPFSITSGDFYWRLTITDTSGLLYYFNTSRSSQTVSSLPSISVTTATCGAGLNPAYRFTFADEQNRNALSSNVSYNFKYGLEGNLTGKVINGSIANTLNFTLCVNSSVPTYTLGYGEIKYIPINYSSREYYLFTGTRLINITTNVTLYSLLTDDAVPFLYTVTDTQYETQPSVYLGILRWYPEIDSYILIGMGKTDDKGQALVGVETNDVDYRIAVYNTNGSLINLFNPTKFYCSVVPCVYSVMIPINPSEFINLRGLQSSLSWNSTTKRFSYIWNDPSQQTDSMNLTVYLDTGANSTIICSSSSNGFTGLLVCDVSAYAGTVRAMVYRSASPTIPIESLIQYIGQVISDTANGKSLGLFFSFILFAFTFLGGLFNPVIAIILGIVSLAVSLYLGVISVAVFTGIIILAFIVIHWMRRT